MKKNFDWDSIMLIIAEGAKGFYALSLYFSRKKLCPFNGKVGILVIAIV